MAYQPHTLVTFGGNLTEVSGNDEIWECGVRGFDTVGSLQPVDQGQLQALIDDICARTTGNLADWMSAAGSHNGSAASLTFGKAVNILPDGTYAGAPAIHEFSPAVTGGTGNSLPTFNTIVYGWTTGRSFGRARSGRIYPPNFGSNLDQGTSTISPASQADLVNAAVALIATLTSEGSEYQFTPYVVSKSGVSNLITGVRIPNVIDVQRRRKNAVRPTYLTSAV